MSVVDYVCESNSKDAVDIIKKIKPNIYCKGPDYKNFKDDLTNKIYDEVKALKSITINHPINKYIINEAFLKYSKKKIL